MPATSSKKHRLFPVLTIVVSALLFGTGFLFREHVLAEPPEVSTSVAEATAVPVRVSEVERRVIPAQARFHGFLTPLNELTLAARVPGEIMHQSVEVSDEVTTGQTLFKIDETVRQIEREQALAAQQRASSEAELAEANWRRIAAMSEQTSSSMERIEAQMQHRAAEADKHRAAAAVRRAAVLLERTTVRSPIDGVVSRIYSRRGEFTQQGQPLLDVIEIDRLKLIAQVEDHDIVWMRVGRPVTLTTSALPGEQFRGEVRRVYPQALPTSRKFEIEIELPNPNRRLRPGFFMIGTITAPADGDADTAGVLIVPRESVVVRYGRHYCYVVHAVSDKDGAEAGFEARRTPVSVLPLLSDPRSYQLVSGVVAGDLVVTKGHQHLSEHAPVRITD